MIEPQAQKRPAFTLLLLLAILAPVLTLTMVAPGQELPYRPGFGSELVYQCKAYVRITSGSQSAQTVDVDDVAAGYRCLGYLDGFEDGTDSEFRTRSNPGKDYWTTRALCIPPHTLDTLVKVYLAFMEKNPKYLDDDKATSLRMALHDAYPCTK